jgi:chromate transporter
MDWKLLWNLFIVCTKVSILTWGGGSASIALMQRETVNAGWMTSEEFADSVAIGMPCRGQLPPN